MSLFDLEPWTDEPGYREQTKPWQTSVELSDGMRSGEYRRRSTRLTHDGRWRYVDSGEIDHEAEARYGSGTPIEEVESGSYVHVRGRVWRLRSAQYVINRWYLHLDRYGGTKTLWVAHVHPTIRVLSVEDARILDRGNPHTEGKEDG